MRWEAETGIDLCYVMGMKSSQSKSQSKSQKDVRLGVRWWPLKLALLSTAVDEETRAKAGKLLRVEGEDVAERKGFAGFWQKQKRKGSDESTPTAGKSWEW